MDEIISKSAVVPIDLTGKTTLKQLAHIIKNSKSVVAGDTGPMHLAAALQTPVVALFGPTDPERNGPYGTGHSVLTVSHPCQGCWQRQCREGRSCLADIAVNDVFQALMKSISS